MGGVMSVAVAGIPKTQRSWRLNAWRAFLALGLAAGMVLVAFPEIDLMLAEATFSPGSGFIGWRIGWLGVLRAGFIVFYFGTIAVSIAGWLANLKGYGRYFRPKQWLFLLVCLGVGPGLLANVGFKDQWGRARPKHVMAFGGNKIFTPALLPTNQCKRNCSFVSGEASSVFAPFYAAAAIAPQWAATLIVVGTAAGLGSGAVRIAQGAHFLSDVVFAGLFMGLMVLALHPLMVAPRGSWGLALGMCASARRLQSTSNAKRIGPNLDIVARVSAGQNRLTTAVPQASPDSRWPRRP
jgi:lipid A 4'-phosphatase